MAQPRSWAGWWCRRGCPTLTSVLEGTSDSLLKIAKSEHFQMLHSPDYLLQICAPKSLDLWREINKICSTYSWWFILCPDLWKCFTMGSLGNGTVGGFIGQTCSVYFRTIPESDWCWEHRVVYAKEHLSVKL